MSIDGHLHHLQDARASRVAESRASREVPGFAVAAPYAPILNLQRTIGNRAVGQLVAQRQLDPRSGQLMREEVAPASEEAPAPEVPLTPLQEVGRTVPAETEDAADPGRVVHLEGRTTAHFSQSNNAFQSENTQLSRAQHCEGGCSDSDPCVNVSTTIVCTYQVPIDVHLPDLNEFDLNDCERQQAQNWIDTVLSPHEEQHRQKFQTYNGTTRRPLTFTTCNSQAQTELDSRAEAMMTSEQLTRQASAQSLSDALDPFNFDFEINCPAEEEESEAAPAPDAGS